MFGKIIGTGSYVPKEIVTNKDLAQYLDTDDTWIRERTGVKSRHISGDNETTADMAVKAAEKALDNSGLLPDEIDLIIVSSVSSNLVLPSTACFVQKAINAKNAFCFDINVACTGFITAYNISQTFINTGLINTALVIGAENLSKITDWSDRKTCILFGDGAGAVVIKKDENAMFETVMFSNGEDGDALTMENPFALRKTNLGKNHQGQFDISFQDIQKTYINMDGGEIFKFAVKKVPECIEALLEKIHMDKDEIDKYLLHQANSRIIEGIAKRSKIPLKKIPLNIEDYGNVSSACIPMLLDKLKGLDEIKAGDKIIMAGFGAGLSYGATYLEF